MKITIVGGGTAAWMAASYLSRHHPNDQITVIDKEVGNPIGVGEATVLDFQPFMKECGFNINDWMPIVDGSFKSGIMFPNWKRKGNTVWHPFLTQIEYQGFTQWDIWAQNQSNPFETHGLPMLSVSENNKVDLERLDFYAYHVDCGKLINFMQEKIKNFITIIKSTVVEVKKDNNKIKELILANGDTHQSDLYIDCTGFLSLLKEQKRINLEGRLFCNTAIAGHVPYIDKQKEFRPYVISEAVDHGWIWKIPTQSRFGSGLVFNRNITDVETAKDYFVEHWDHRITKDKLKVIDWTPYYISNQWDENVVSIGLSGGFIEPLESTGLALMRKGIKRLSEATKLGTYDQYDIDLFNARMIKTYEDTIDFISMHYADTERDEPFWQYVKETHKKSNTQIFFEKFLSNPQENFSQMNIGQQEQKMFGTTNWLLWLIQLRYPVNKLLNIPPAYVETVMEEFLNNENLRLLRGIDHISAVEMAKKRGIREP